MGKWPEERPKGEAAEERCERAEAGAGHAGPAELSSETLLLDPMARLLGQLRPPLTAPVFIPSAALERVAQELVRRFSMSGNSERGTARLEFGSGVLDGGSLIVDWTGAAVCLTLDAPAGLDESELAQLVSGLKRRLDEQGTDIEEFEVRR